MVALWLLELLLSFCLAYMLLGSGQPAAVLQASTANHALILALTVGMTAFAMGLYRTDVFRRTRGMLINTALGGLLAFPAAWLVSRLMGMDVDRLVGHDAYWPMKIVVVWIAALFGTRLLFLAGVRSGMFVRRVAVLGPPTAMAGTVAAVHHGQRGFIEVAGGSQSPAGLREARVWDAVLPQAALLAMPAAERAEFAAHGVTLEGEAQFWERRLRRVDVAHIDQVWIDALDARPTSRLSAIAARTEDVAISLVILVFTLPLMLLAGLLVRLDSAGPILYRQERVGLGGRPFTLLKFRSMRADAEARGPAWASQRDPRVTRVGSFMRRTRIDELPQLLNVLRGEMGFIGPRPERPHFVEHLSEVIPFYRERTRVKPGLTGWAQVNFPYGASVEDARVKLSYDLFYVKYRSPLLDLGILFSTVRVILFQEGSR